MRLECHRLVEDFAEENGVGNDGRGAARRGQLLDERRSEPSIEGQTEARPEADDRAREAFLVVRSNRRERPWCRADDPRG